MLEYDGYDIVFQEIPNEISLVLNITNCPYRCEGCHSPHLQNQYGEVLTEKTIDRLLERYSSFVTVFLFSGGDRYPERIKELSKHIKQKWSKIKVGMFSGSESFSPLLINKNKGTSILDYYKVGAYIQEKGGLREPATNQKLWRFRCSKEAATYNWLLRKWEKKTKEEVLDMGFPAKVYDDKDFDKTTIYYAAPMFSEAYRKWNPICADRLRDMGYEVYNPCENMEINDKTKTSITNSAIFLADSQKVLDSEILIAVLDDEDPGVIAELTLAIEHGIRTIVLATDSRLLTPPNTQQSGVDNQTLYLNQYVMGMIRENRVPVYSSFIDMCEGEFIEDVKK